MFKQKLLDITIVKGSEDLHMLKNSKSRCFYNFLSRHEFLNMRLKRTISFLFFYFFGAVILLLLCKGGR